MASTDRFNRIATNNSRYSYATAYNANNKTLSGRAPRGAQVPVYVDNTLNGTATADESGNWSLVLSGTINPGQAVKTGNATGNGVNQRSFTIPTAPALGTLSLSAYAPFARVHTPIVGEYFAARIAGGSGGVLSLSGAGSAGLSISQNYIISGYPTSEGPINVIETLGTASNSPRTTSAVTTTVTSGAGGWLPTPGALLDVDFAASRALAGGQQYPSLAAYLASPGLSFSRASKKTAQKKDGTLVSFDNDVPARTDRGLLLEPAATNFVPFNSDLTGAGWGGTVGGTAPATNAVPANAAAPVSYPSPDGTGAEAGKGVTNSGLVWDAARSRFLIGNDGGRNENVTGVARQTSIVAVDLNFTKIGEWPLIWPGDTVNDQGIQGIGVDTKRDLVIAVVPSRQYIAFFNPTTMAVVKTLPLPSGFLPNGLAYDSLRDEYWVTDNATLFIHRIGQDGRIVATYKPGAIETPGLDQLCYLPASDELLFTAGANNTSGTVFSLDCAKLRVKRAMTCVEAKAIEGVAVVGSDLFVCSDGYFHNASAPYNVNVILKYPASSLVAFGYQRLWADFADFNGLGVKADRLIMDKGAGTTASDLRSFFITAAASGSTATKTLSVWMRSADGETYTVYIRGDTTIANVVVGPTWQRYSITGSMISAPSIQVGLRKGNAPYNTSDFADIVIAGFQCELGSVATSLIENATASAATRAADSGTLAVVAGPKDLVATFDDGSTQTISAVNGSYPVPVNLNRPTLARLVAMAA